MKKTFLALLLLTFFMQARADFSIGYFPINHSMIQATTNPERRLFGDIRVQTNSFISNSNIELAPFLNVYRKEMLNVYIGIGGSFNPFNQYNDASALNGYFITVGGRVKPFNNKQFAVLFEISPYVNQEMASGMIRTNLGLSYCFKRR